MRTHPRPGTLAVISEAAPTTPTIRLPLTIRRRGGAAMAEAFLIETAEAGPALGLLAALAGEGQGGAAVFAAGGGLLVRAESPSRLAWPGAVRLRKAHAGFFVPVDAELSPALLEDEAEGLTRDRGLVVLPGGRVLAFEPDRPLPMAALLEVERPERPRWVAPPEPPRIAERLEEIVVARPDDETDAMLRAGGADIATEDARPEDPGAPRRAVGGAALGAGRGMVWLGEKLGMKGLAGLGAKWMGAAMGMAPRLSEAVLGRQEGALRDLLREFREGDVEKALRRALPIGKGTERGAGTSIAADLPDRDTRYSLPEILGTAGGGVGGRAGYWLGGFDVQQELAREYHKAAHEAVRRGDYRRAAFIYAKLLEDYRLAAGVLLQGGLARDAALIYLEKVGDKVAAARAFETAGDFDRALALYRETEDHEHAGDLLVRLGEPDAALVAYREAAARIVRREGDHLKAGDLLRDRAGRPDLAAACYAEGWASRPSGTAVGCAVALASWHADRGDADALRTLAVEADESLATPGHEASASRFYNALAALGDHPSLLASRDELRDRARIGLAQALRRRAGEEPPPGLVGTVFGPARHWSVELIRDAEYAVAAASRRPGPARRGVLPSRRPSTVRVQVATGPLTAVAIARGAGLAFLGTKHGDVVRLDLATGEATRIARYALPVAALATAPTGRGLVVLWYAEESGRTVLAAYERRPAGAYHMTEGRAEPSRRPVRPRLATPAASNAEVVGLWDGRRHVLLRGTALVPWAEVPPADPTGPDDPGRPALLLPRPIDEAGLAVGVLELGPAGAWGWSAAGLDERAALPVPWEPRGPADAPGVDVAPCWLRTDARELVVAGVGEGGAAYRTTLRVRDDRLDHDGTAALGPAGEPCRAVGLLRPALMAAVGTREVTWLRAGATRLVPLSTSAISLRTAVAVADSPKTGELVLLGADGWAERLPIPGH